ncbi:protein tramtrack, beta isoform-like isoform X3 [Cloeon dipterum]|uniref:protein tramtrack, beta isoform-like isoform X3 n=1 Tax=Cloeon dipterum TaxID=197152 RepID=UPI0032209F71
MASQQYSLRWNNYVRHMTSAFESLRSDKDLIDVTLSCEGKKIPAHKMLLSACSSYFKDLFKENPCQHPVIIFRNVTHDDLMALVDFMYNGEVNVEQEQLASFLHTAELLQVQGLTNSNKDSETKTKKTAKQQDDRVPAPEVQFDEDGHPSPYQSDERTSTPTRTGPPAAAKKRKWQSPSRTASPAEVQAIAQVSAGANSGGEGEEGESHQMDEVPLKTEPDYDDDDDEQASGADDAVEEQESIIAKIQKSDQLILTTSTSRSRASNSDHSLFGGNVMDMLSTSESGDMSNFVMAGPSNESMGQEGIQEMNYEVMDGTWQTLEDSEVVDLDDSFPTPIIVSTFSLADIKDFKPFDKDQSAPLPIRRSQRQSSRGSKCAEPQRVQPTRKTSTYRTPASCAVQQISKKYKYKKTFAKNAAKTRAINSSHKPNGQSVSAENRPPYRVRATKGSFKCELCSKCFKIKNSLSLHYDVHKGKTTCPICKRVFSRNSDMVSHLYSYHYADQTILKKVGKKSQEHLEYKCPLCSLSFKRKSKFMQHLYREHEHKPN